MQCGIHAITEHLIEAWGFNQVPMLSYITDIDPKALMATDQTILMQLLDLTQDLPWFLS